MGKKAVAIFESIYPLIIYYAIISLVTEGLLHFTVLKDISYSLPQVIAKIICIPAMLYFYNMSKHKSRLGKSAIEKVKAAFIAIIAGVTSCIVFNFLIEVINLKAYSPMYRKVINAMGSDVLIIQIIGAIIIAPIIEEIVFRGIFYYKLRQAIPTVLAILISAVVFGIAHFNIVQGVYAALLGVVFALIYEKTGELWTAVLAHMAANTFAFFGPALYNLPEKILKLF